MTDCEQIPSAALSIRTAAVLLFFRCAPRSYALEYIAGTIQIVDIRPSILHRESDQAIQITLHILAKQTNDPQHFIHSSELLRYRVNICSWKRVHTKRNKRVCTVILFMSHLHIYVGFKTQQVYSIHFVSFHSHNYPLITHIVSRVHLFKITHPCREYARFSACTKMRESGFGQIDSITSPHLEVQLILILLVSSSQKI